MDTARRSLRGPALCNLELLGDSWKPRASHFKPRAFCSLQLLGDTLDAARRLL